MVAKFFSTPKVDPQRRIKEVKKLEKRGLVMPALIGFALCGGLYAGLTGSSKSFRWAEFLTFGGGGAIACVLSRAVANQPGSSEMLRSLMLQTDSLMEATTEANENMRNTQERLDRQQGLMASASRATMEHKASLDAAAAEMRQFRSSLYQMATGGSHKGSSTSASAYESHETAAQQAALIEDDFGIEEAEEYIPQPFASSFNMTSDEWD